MRKPLLVALLVAFAPGCFGATSGNLAQRVNVVTPLSYGAVAVRVMNPPGSEESGVWLNDCQQVPRLGEETRLAWLTRVERYIESRAYRLASVTYPVGDGVDVAMVCFSTPQ